LPISKSAKFLTRAREGWGKCYVLRYDLPSKKSSLQKIFGSNLTLRNKKVVEIPVKQWATLRVARKNFSENELSFSLAHLYSTARTIFMEDLS
jgi:hypothetical protein